MVCDGSLAQNTALLCEGERWRDLAHPQDHRRFKKLADELVTDQLLMPGRGRDSVLRELSSASPTTPNVLMRHATLQSDTLPAHGQVYSFGMVILEVLTAIPPATADPSKPGGGTLGVSCFE